MAGAGQSRRWLWWGIGYLLLLIVVVVAMVKVRQSAITQLSNPKSTAEWQEWREGVRREQSAGGPVQRRMPKSEEPPALVLMRDHFATSLFGVIVFSSALYWVMAWFVDGVTKAGNGHNHPHSTATS